jgi:hypothetical protein
MKTRDFCAVLWVLAASACFAQTAPTQQTIEAKLRSAPFLMLRGMWDGGRLTFDSQGNLVGTAETVPLSMRAMKLTGVELSDSALVVSGYHAGLEFSFNGAMAHAVARGKVPLEVAIARDPKHTQSLDEAISKVFAIGIDEGVVSTAPDYWRPWLQHHLHPHDLQEPLPAGVQTLRRGVVPPRITYSAGPPRLSPGQGDPEHPAEVILSCIVDTSGRPFGIHVAMPSGMGRDEAAVLALSQTLFTPAIEKGTPVAVTMQFHFQYFLGER